MAESKLPEIDFNNTQPPEKSDKAPPVELPEVTIGVPRGFKPVDEPTNRNRARRDVLRAGARTAGMPTDLVDFIINTWIKGNEDANPFYWPHGVRSNLPGSQELIDIGERRGVIPQIIEETALERLGSAGAEEALTAIGGQFMLNPLSRLGPMAKKVFGWGENPVSTLATVGSIGGAGGVGGELAAGVDPALRPYGMIAGTLSPLAAMGLYRKMQTTSPLNPEQQQRLAGGFLQDAVTDPAAVMGTQLSDYGVPGFTTTLGRASDDPGLLRAEKGLIVSDPVFAGSIDEMQRLNKAALRGHLEQTTPHADPQAAKAFAEGRARLGTRRRADQVADARVAATTKVDDAQRQVAPEVERLSTELEALRQADATITTQLSREESSAAIEAALQGARAGAKDEAARLYDLAKQYEDVVLPVDSLVDLRNTLQADAVKRGWTSELPKLLRTPLDDQGQRIADVTLDDFLLSGQGPQIQGMDAVSPIMSAARLEGLRGLVRKRLRELESTGLAESPESGYLKQLSGGIDRIFDDVGSGSVPWVPPEMATAYKDARTFYGSQYKPVFGSRAPVGAGLEARQPTTFMAPFFKKGEAGGVLADQLVKAGGATSLEDAVKQYVLDVASRATTNRNGLVSVDKLARFNKDYAEFLQRFPGLHDELLQVQGAQSAINARRELLKGDLKQAETTAAETVKKAEQEAKTIVKDAERRQAYYESPAVRGRWAARYFLDKDPDHAVRSVLADKDQARAVKQVDELLRQDSSGEALAGFQRAYLDNILDRVTQRVEGPGVKAGTLSKILDQEQVVIQKFLTPEQRKALDNVLRAANVDLRQARRAAIAGGSGTPEGLQAASVVNELVALRLGGPFTRRVLWLLDRTGMQVSQESVKLLLREAMVDPAVMKELLTIPTKPNLNMQLSNRLTNLLGRVSSTQTDQVEKPSP